MSPRITSCSELMAGTPAEDYFARFAKVITSLRQNGISVPIFVAIESGYCDGAATPRYSGTRVAQCSSASRRFVQ